MSAFSSVSAGLDSLRSLRGIQSFILSFHSTITFHPFVLIRPFFHSLIADLLILWYDISFIRISSLPYSSTCDNEFSNRMLWQYSSSNPSSSSTSYFLVSKIGFWLYSTRLYIRSNSMFHNLGLLPSDHCVVM